MAGDWIQIDVTLPTQKKVISMAGQLGVSPFEVVGRLVHFWGWFTGQEVRRIEPPGGMCTRLGRRLPVDGAVDATVDAVVDVGVATDMFIAQMMNVGWLAAIELDGREWLAVPNYDSWLSKCAKGRRLKAMRQRKWREAKARAEEKAAGDTLPNDSCRRLPVDGPVDAGVDGPKRKRDKSKKKTTSSCRALRFDEADRETAEWMFDLIRGVNPAHRKPNLDKWANEIRLMRERDDRIEYEIRGLFKWANQDGFWQANILSPAKLREKWDQLTLKRKSGHAVQVAMPVGPGQRHPADAEREGF